MSDKNNDDININKQGIHLKMDSAPGDSSSSSAWNRHQKQPYLFYISHINRPIDDQCGWRALHHQHQLQIHRLLY